MKNPKLISKPFAQNGQKNVIPEKYETSMESNQATWDQGFGQITMLPVSAGGLPPKGQDFNGILNQMCETIVHISKGGAFKFSADYATAINGYPKGAILQSEDEKKYYQSIIDNNKVNFNTASQDQIKTSWKLVMTDDLLDQLSKKLESSAVVQSTGTSTTSVMSQKASTDVFQPKGDYALKSSKDHFQSGEHKITGNFATLVLETADGASCFLEKKNNSPTPYFINRDASGVNTSTIDIPNESGTLALLSDLEEVNNIPVGSPIPWSLATAPSGYLICNGQTFNKSTYPKLAIAYPSGKLRDLRGEFIRGLDSGRGIDAGREVLSYQSGNSLLSAMWRGTVTGQKDWENKTSYNVEIGTDKSGYYTIGQQIEGSGSNETRPRNIAFLYIVRAA